MTFQSSVSLLIYKRESSSGYFGNTTVRACVQSSAERPFIPLISFDHIKKPTKQKKKKQFSPWLYVEYSLWGQYNSVCALKENISFQGYNFTVVISGSLRTAVSI